MPKGKNKPEDIFVSVALLADETANKTHAHIKSLSKLLTKHYRNYEIVVIDNNMPAKNLQKTVELLDKLPHIRIVRLSKTTTKDTAAFAGLGSAIGDHVVLLVSDHDPIELIPQFVEANKTADMVLGVSKRQMRKGLLNRYGSEIFYWYNKKYLGISIPSTSTYFMSLNRRAVNALTRTGRNSRHIRYMVRQVGYHPKEISYEPLESAKPYRRRSRDLVITALELTASYSKHPLRLITWLGLGAAILNLIYGAYVGLIAIYKDDVAEGWTTLSMQASVMFFFLFLVLAVLCEYVGKILEESRNEATYHIMDELTSKIGFAESGQRNIVK